MLIGLLSGASSTIKCSLIDYISAKSLGEAKVHTLMEANPMVVAECGITDSDLVVVCSSKLLESFVLHSNMLNWETFLIEICFLISKIG